MLLLAARGVTSLAVATAKCAWNWPPFAFILGGCRHAVTWDPLNLRTLQEAVEKGRLQPGTVVTMKTLYDAGLLSKKIDHGIKLLGTVSPLLHRFLMC